MISHSLEHRIQDMHDLSEEELLQLKSTLREQTSLADHTPDLRLYQRSQREHLREAQKQSHSGLQRVVQRIKEAVGLTSERAFTQQLNAIRTRFDAYAHKCDQLTQLYDQRQEELSETMNEFTQLKMYFGACQQHYRIVLASQDTLEAELEELELCATGEFTPHIHEKRSQLFEVTQTAHDLYIQTEEAMREYMHTKQRMHAYSDQLDELNTVRGDAEQQRTALRIKLSSWELHKELRMNPSATTLNTLYEGLAIASQDMDAVLSGLPGSDSLSFDSTYAVSLGSEQRDDPLVNQWRQQQPPQ